MRSLSRYLTLLSYWVRATFPALVVIGFGVTTFRAAVIESIESTPHPELVYVILGGFFLALFLAWWALARFVREEAVLIRWQAKPPALRQELLSKLHWTPALTPLYDLLSGKSKLPLRMRQAAVQSEIEEFENHLFGKLTLAGYIGGALIGLGLVGTFVGLLATLRDLSSLFEALIGGNGGPALTQAEMFKDMISRMQAPMKGMGTAFVASLYGLLGSLIVGLVIMNVRKIGSLLVDRVHKSVREYDYGVGSDVGVALQADMAWAESERWKAMYSDMRERNENLMALVLRMQDETTAVLQASKDLNQSMRDRNELDGVMAKVIAGGADALAKASEHHESILRSAADTRIDIQSMVQATKSINETLQARNSIDALVQRALSEGMHWMTAWDEISTELRRVRGFLESSSQQGQALQLEQNTHLKYLLEAGLRQESALLNVLHQTGQHASSSMAEHKSLVHALETCRQSFEEVGSKLRLQLNLNAAKNPMDFPPLTK
jgi:hypothetical protein